MSFQDPEDPHTLVIRPIYHGWQPRRRSARSLYPDKRDVGRWTSLYAMLEGPEMQMFYLERGVPVVTATALCASCDIPFNPLSVPSAVRHCPTCWSSETNGMNCAQGCAPCGPMGACACAVSRITIRFAT